MKKLIVLIISLALLLSLVACAVGSPSVGANRETESAYNNGSSPGNSSSGNNNTDAGSSTGNSSSGGGNSNEGNNSSGDVLDLSPVSEAGITDQSTRFSASGNTIKVSGTDPLTIRGDSTAGGWVVDISEAIDIIIENNTIINNASLDGALNVPSGAVINGGGSSITISASRTAII